MAIHIIKNSQAWRECLSGMAHINPYQTWDYTRADALHRNLDFALFEIANEQGSMAIPLLMRPITFGQGSQLFDAVSPYGYPGFAYSDQPCFNIIKLWDELKSYFYDKGIVSVVVRMDPFDGPDLSYLNDLNPLHVSDVVWMNLDQSEDDILSGCKKSTRYDWRRFSNLSGSHTQTDTASEFVKLYHETMTRLNADPDYFFSHEYLSILECTNDFEFSYWNAIFQNENVASFCTITLNDTAHYHLSASSVSCAQLAPTKFIIISAAMALRQKGIKRFNLGGGLGASHGSLYQFKAGFSPNRAPFYILRVVSNQAAYQTLEANHRSCSGPIQGSFFPTYRAPVTAS